MGDKGGKKDKNKSDKQKKNKEDQKSKKKQEKQQKRPQQLEAIDWLNSGQIFKQKLLNKKQACEFFILKYLYLRNDPD